MSSTISATGSNCCRNLVEFIYKYWLLLLAGALLILSQHNLLIYYWSAWNEKDSYYSHGPLVPILAVIMIRANRERLPVAIDRGSWLGLPLLITAIPLYAIGMAFGWRPICAVVMFLLLYGSILATIGKKAFAILFLPILFLWTMIPIYQLGLDVATGRFQIISSTVAAHVLRLSGNEIIQNGNVITSYGLPCPLVVGSPCSGLKLLIALVMCTCFLVYMLQGSAWKKALLLGSSLPFSIIINSVRIILIAVVGFVTESTDAVHSFHDLSGYISLVLCAFMVMRFARIIGLKQFQEFSVDKSSTAPKKVLQSMYGLSPAGVSALVILASMVGIGSLLSGLYNIPKGHIDRSAVPVSFGSWISQDLQIDASTREMLNKGDLLSRAYNDVSGVRSPVQLFLSAAIDRSAFHDPHLCLPGSGNRIIGERILNIKVSGTKSNTIHATLLHLEDTTGSKMIVVYWYILDCLTYPRHLQDLQPAILESRISDMKQLITSPSSVQDLRRDIASRQITWYRFSTEVSDWDSGENFLKGFITEFLSQ